MRLIRIPVFLGFLFVRCKNGIASDAADSSQQLNSPELPTVTNDHHSFNEMAHSYAKNTSGAQVKQFINALTRNFTKRGTFKQRTYARRISRTLSNERLYILYNVLPEYLYRKEKLEKEKRALVLEIGFGSGDHFIHQAKLKPDALFLGVEAYLNGVANALKLAVLENVSNILVYPDNIDYIFEDIPNSSLSQVYILFPDPWHKSKHNKKRFMNEDRIRILQAKLSDSCSFVFASDMEEYFDEVIRLTEENGGFEITNKDDYLNEPDNYIETRYHMKALAQKNEVKFLICKKK